MKTTVQTNRYPWSRILSASVLGLLIVMGPHAVMAQPKDTTTI